MDNIKTAIRNSNKIQVLLNNGKTLTIHPYFILQSSFSQKKFVHGMIEKENLCDVNMEDIKSVSILQQTYSVDYSCLKFNFRDYEVVFPKENDFKIP
jgi:hypothetical protein